MKRYCRRICTVIASSTKVFQERKNHSAIEYNNIPPERFQDVIKHLRNTFFADEPLNKAVGLCQSGKGHVELEELCFATLEENLSIMAVTSDHEIAGVVLNGVLLPGDMESSQKKINASNDENFKKIFNLIYGVNLKCNIFERYKIKKLFDLRILSVDGRFRGRNIAKELVNRSTVLAKKSGFKLVKADATRIFSQKILKSCEFKVLHELYYAKYTDKNGAPIIPVESPHIKLEILVKKIN